MGTPTQVCVRSCPNFSAPAGRPFSAGRPAAESLGRGRGERVGRGGRGRRPKEGNDERIEDFNGQGNDQGLGANGGVEGVNRNVSNRGNVGNQNGNVVNENVQENVGNVLVNSNRVGCSYKEFLACNPKEYDGKGGVVVLTRWIEKMENVQDMSGCSNDQKVKYTTGLFVGKALTWWNSQIRTLSREVVNHAMVGAGHATYTDWFHELAGGLGSLHFNRAKALQKDSARKSEFGDCRGVPRNVNSVNAKNPTVRACYECGSTDHVRSACPRLNRAQEPDGKSSNQVAVYNRGQSRGNQGTRLGEGIHVGAEKWVSSPGSETLVSGKFTLKRSSLPSPYLTLVLSFSFVSTTFLSLVRNKKDERGIVIRNKARLVAQGYTQEKGIDYDEVFALVARIEAIRLFLAYASFKDFVVYQMDIKSAFLYKKIEEEVYMSSMGELTLFLGLQVNHKKDGIFISQDKYVDEILKKFRFTEVKTASTPIETQKLLLKDEDGEEVDVHMYRSMIGSLMYLTSSRPDIMYLKGQPKLGLWYSKDSPFDLVAYTDSDYTGASLDRLSTTGGCQFLGCRLISWQCKKQTVVANSIIEAEYVAASSCCGQVLWIQNQLLDYGKAKKSVKLMMEKLFRMELELMLVADTHNMVAFLSKPTKSDGFEQIMDFLNAHSIRHALTINPTIHTSCIEQFWSTVKAKTINGEAQLHALVDGKKKIITESTVRRDLQLEDAEGVDCLPNSTIFEHLTLMGYEKISQKLTFYKLFFSFQWGFLIHTILQCLSSKTTAWNEFSSIMASAIICLATNQKFNFSKYIFENETVHKELGNSLVRAATTASSLEAKQDSGNITKTRSKATPNESSSLGTTSGGGPRCQETMGDTIAQTRFENVSKLSNDSLLARESSGDEEDLGEDASKQGRRINAIDADEDITLVSVQDDADKEMFDVDALNGEEVFVAGKNKNIVEEVVDAAQVSTAATTVTITTEETTLAQALKALNSSKPKDNGKVIMIEEHVKPMKKKVQIMLDEEAALKLQAEFDEEERLAREKPEKEKEANIALIEELDDIQAKIDADHQLAKRLQAQEQEELSDAEKATLFQQLLEKRRKHFAAKRAEERRKNPLTKAQQRQIMCTYLKNMKGYKLKDLKSKGFDSIQDMFDKAFKRVNTFEDFRTELVEGKEKRAGEELMQENAKKQNVEDDKETSELKQCLEIILDEEEVTIDDVPLAVKSPSIVGWKIHKEGRKSYYQIMRADGKSQMYMIFSHMLKSFSRKDLEDLYKLVKAKYKSIRPVEDLDLLSWGDLKTMFKPHVEDTVWRNQQDYKVLDCNTPKNAS
ncbi:uncharacterized mitochondrial protein-like protein [Tanacetum coccineum]